MAFNTPFVGELLNHEIVSLIIIKSISSVSTSVWLSVMPESGENSLSVEYNFSEPMLASKATGLPEKSKKKK